MNNYLALLKKMLPEVLVDHFDLIKTEEKGEELHIHFEEKNEVPPEHNSLQLVSHGLRSPIQIQDFPLRGLSVILHIRRRRWKDKQSGKLVQRDWSLVATGTRLTEEFASFLKELNRY